MQDIPFVTVLRSNIGGFTDNELVEIRLSDKYDNFYNCMLKAKVDVKPELKQKIEKTYQKFGFLPLDTPILEFSEVLLAKAGGETEKQIYRFNKGDSDLSLRFDLTVPLAKYVAKSNAVSLIGGGDSIAAIQNLGYAKKITHWDQVPETWNKKKKAK